jgi:hypothetical protein
MGRRIFLIICLLCLFILLNENTIQAQAIAVRPFNMVIFGVGLIALSGLNPNKSL